MVVYWAKNSGDAYELDDLKYFETDLTKGEHKIRVEYTANVWTDISGWVKEYSFRYSLSPARNWRSFGALEISVSGATFHSEWATNLGKPKRGNHEGVSVWNFSKLPSDYFEIVYMPQIGWLAKTLIAIGPIGLTIILALLISTLHYFGIRRYRNSSPAKKYSWVVIAGSIVNPFLILIGYVISYGLIDRAIGTEAGSYHGYMFMAIVLYPLLLPVYWLLTEGADRLIKGRINI